MVEIAVCVTLKVYIMRDCLMDGVWVPTCHLKKSIPSRAEKCVCVWCVWIREREREREGVCDWCSRCCPRQSTCAPCQAPQVPEQGWAVLLIRHLSRLPLIPLETLIPRLVSFPLSHQWGHWHCFQAIHWGSLILTHTHRHTHTNKLSACVYGIFPQCVLYLAVCCNVCPPT